MERGLFYITFFENITLFFSCVLIMVIISFLSMRKVSISGVMDPVHFYWTFTFGTAYGIVLALFLNGDIKLYLFLMVFSYGLAFVIFSNLFLKMNIKPFNRFFIFISNARTEPRILLFIVQLLFIINLFIIINFVGFGFLAEENRFEQNRGMGAFIRIFVVLRLFLISYYTLLLVELYNRKRIYSFSFILYSLIFFIFIVFTSLVDGAKFALLESMLAIFVAITLFKGRPKFSFIKLSVLISVSFLFAVVLNSVNLKMNNLEDSKSSYIVGAPFVIEAISLRVLANADKYFLSLPNEVLETVEVKSAWVRLIAPVIGSTRLSNILGYNVNDYSIGKQVLLYWDPRFDISGGPTSHFDLFAYKQFGFIFGFLWVFLTAFILVGIRNISLLSLKSKYSISIAVVLLIRSWPLIIEPPLGLSYIIDVFIIFLCLIMFNSLFKNKGYKIG